MSIFLSLCMYVCMYVCIYCVCGRENLLVCAQPQAAGKVRVRNDHFVRIQGRLHTYIHQHYVCMIYETSNSQVLNEEGGSGDEEIVVATTRLETMLG